MQNRLSIAVGFDASLEDEVTGGKNDDRIVKPEPRRLRLAARLKIRAGICPFAGGPEAARAGKELDSPMLRSLSAIANRFRGSYLTGIMRCA
ncbi:MAG: hypothetical protein EOR04_20245 [Mesorhizobium sp.]|uniref:hypothetical protein n=1 Tax=Mesorhizobium sp. TaxID=1871066 RepID=UPI000FEA7C08|nr:hypothetical protein [Mesorhizobium sp.]RWP40045.1 MAG: hypothetical protein EOR04_20245 [Mesorhizobium sp.]